MYVSPKYPVWQHFETLCIVTCKMVITSVGLVSSFLDTIRVSVMTIFTIFDSSRVWIFHDILILNAIRVYIPCKNPHF